VGATWAVEFPIKRAVRRRRPFVDVVSAIVVGKKPGSWSHPSGHTTASFACARVLASVWPRGAPVFYALASVVGVSRVYVGDHYPGDVLSGATCGLVLAEVLYRLVGLTSSQPSAVSRHEEAWPAAPGSDTAARFSS